MQRNTLFVKGFPREFSEDNLKTIFGAHGNIVSCSIGRSQDRPNYWGMIEFVSHFDAQNALK